MPKDAANSPLRTSLWDRLLDEDLPETPGKPQAQLLREIIQAVQRDLENLLNSRWHHEDCPAEFTQLQDSLINYGLPDFSTLSEPRNFRRLCDIIRTCIERFEPRLQRVSVEPLSDRGTLERVVRFRIQAILQVEPLSDRIAFTSTLEPFSGNFHVERANS